MMALFYNPFIGSYGGHQMIFKTGSRTKNSILPSQEVSENKKKEINIAICNRALQVNDFAIAEFVIKGHSLTMNGDLTLVDSLTEENKAKWEKHSRKKPTSQTLNQFCGPDAKCVPCAIL
jgi:hypothetical protein